MQVSRQTNVEHVLVAYRETSAVESEAAVIPLELGVLTRRYSPLGAWLAP